MNSLKVKITGIRPLIMHSAAMIDPDNAFVRQKNELQRVLKKTAKTDEVGREKLRRQIERVEWEGGMYWNSTDGMYLPGKCLSASIVEGAKKSKMGKQCQQGLMPIEDAPIQTKCKTTDLDKLFNHPEYRLEFQLREPVRIPPRTGARMMAVRACVPTGWTCEFTCEHDETVFPLEDLKEAIQLAGNLIGICDWRPRFGKFICEFLE